jgi:hypothetical protein
MSRSPFAFVGGVVGGALAWAWSGVRGYRSSRVLDDRKVGSADRAQALVHAALSAKEQVPSEAPPEGLKRRICLRLEEVEPTPVGVSDQWLLARRQIALPAVLLVLSAGAVISYSVYREVRPMTVATGVAPEAGSVPGHGLAAFADDPEPVKSAEVEALVLFSPRRVASDFAAASGMPASEQRALEQDTQEMARMVWSTLPVRPEDPR